MNRRLLFLSFAAVTVLGVPTSSVSAQSNPVSTLEGFVDARNSADEAGTLALVSTVSNQVRDAWYLEPVIAPTALAPSTQARDRWYLEDVVSADSDR
jgi:hypothetical protein